MRTTPVPFTLVAAGMLVLVLALVSGAQPTGKDGKSADEVAEELEKALKGLRATPAPPSNIPPAPVAPGPPVSSPSGGRFAYLGLVPGQSTKADVDLLLGDPTEERDGRYVYQAPAKAPDVEQISVTYVKGTRKIEQIEVRLKRPINYREFAARAGQRVLEEGDDDDWVWDYRIPGFLGLGAPTSTGPTPPAAAQRLRYVSPQFLADRFVARGDSAAGGQQIDNAITEYEKASRMDPSYALPYLKIGALHQRRKATGQARRYFVAATKAEYPARGKAQGHVHLGLLAYGDKNDGQARAEFTRASQVDPTDADAFFGIGLVEQRAKRFKEAAAAYQKAIGLKRDHVAALHNLGMIQEREGNLKGALASYQKAVDHRPTHASASHKLADVALRAGDFAAAEKECRRRLAVQADESETMVTLAMALSSQAPERSGLMGLLTDDPHLKEAVEWLDRAVTAGYANRAMLEQSPYLRQLREQSPNAFNRVVGKVKP